MTTEKKKSWSCRSFPNLHENLEGHLLSKPSRHDREKRFLQPESIANTKAWLAANGGSFKRHHRDAGRSDWVHDDRGACRGLPGRFHPPAFGRQPPEGSRWVTTNGERWRPPPEDRPWRPPPDPARKPSGHEVQTALRNAEKASERARMAMSGCAGRWSTSSLAEKNTHQRGVWADKLVLSQTLDSLNMNQTWQSKSFKRYTERHLPEPQRDEDDDN
mmetsp:Transcript_42344/g.112039  ORF Transcript_42344/g.112039 Transcript_42344/m.112039 type:complete len:217 (-) Transcript_42344:73-723(-)